MSFYVKSFIHHSSRHPATAKIAIEFLKEICRDNLITDGKGPYKVDMSLFHKIKELSNAATKWIKEGHIERVGESYSNQISEEIISFLKECQDSHPSSTIQGYAQMTLIELNKIDPDRIKLKPLSTGQKEFIELPSQIFDDAVRSVIPWLPGLKSIKHSLETDAQLSDENDFYINSRARDYLTKKEGDLPDLIKDFISNRKDKVLILEGGTGLGKSLGLKNFIYELWKNYSSQKYIPIFGYLPTFNDPTEIINETLKEHALENQKLALEDANILWCFDALDELKASEEKLENFVENNKFSRWQKSKFILTCRSDHFKRDLKTFLKLPSGFGELQKLNILPFSKRLHPI